MKKTTIAKAKAKAPSKETLNIRTADDRAAEFRGLGFFDKEYKVKQGHKSPIASFATALQLMGVDVNELEAEIIIEVYQKMRIKGKSFNLNDIDIIKDKVYGPDMFGKESKDA